MYLYTSIELLELPIPKKEVNFIDKRKMLVISVRLIIFQRFFVKLRVQYVDFVL